MPFCPFPDVSVTDGFEVRLSVSDDVDIEQSYSAVYSIGGATGGSQKWYW